MIYSYREELLHVKAQSTNLHEAGVHIHAAQLCREAKHSVEVVPRPCVRRGTYTRVELTRVPLPCLQQRCELVTRLHKTIS
jgi:hypothetical protein